MSQSKERNKIAEKTHDNIGQALSGAIIKLGAAKLLLGINVPKSKSVVLGAINVV
ncbi:histidine kinase [Clostridium sp.]